MYKVLLAFITGFAACWVYLSKVKPVQPYEAHDLRAGESSWVNPLLECNPDVFEEAPQIKPIKKQVTDYISKFENQHPQTKISVYYKELQSGAWFGHRVGEPFAAASLSKVPVLAKVLKLVEAKPSLLNEKVRYTPESMDLKNIDNNVDKKDQLIPGQEYSISELLDRMILKSDNNSTVLIIDYLKLDLGKMFTDFGITFIRAEGLLHLTAKSYAAIFRILYNSTYINQELSEKALKMLSHNEFTYGLRRLLPKNVVVANKFGSRKFPKKNLAQIHDCGIVYNKNPYLICIMTQGQKLSELTVAISEVSELIFKAKQ